MTCMRHQTIWNRSTGRNSNLTVRSRPSSKPNSRVRVSYRKQSKRRQKAHCMEDCTLSSIQSTTGTVISHFCKRSCRYCAKLVKPTPSLCNRVNQLPWPNYTSHLSINTSRWKSVPQKVSTSTNLSKTKPRLSSINLTCRLKSKTNRNR